MIHRGSLASVSELGAFLRARRQAVAPAEVGLPGGDRRRTLGLRRAELATLAGISVDYLVRLEQGRDRHPSAQVLTALANALRFSFDERVHLTRLAKVTGGSVCELTAPPAGSVRPTVRAVLDRLEPAPAVVLNRLGDLLAYTSGFQRLVGPVGLLDGDRPNLLRYVFTDPHAREVFPDWDQLADQQVAHLKIDSPRADPYLAPLLDELMVIADTAFTSRWHGPALVPDRSGTLRMAQPEVGELRLVYETLEPPDADQRLVVYLPGDDATAAALDHLTAALVAA